MEESFARWVESNKGFLNPHLDFFHWLGGDRGVVAEKGIKEGEVLVDIPLDLCLHMPTEEEWAKHQVCDEAASVLHHTIAEPLSNFHATVLLLMHHISKGKDSMYAPFLSLLPAKHDCTLGWSDEHMAELAGTSIADTGRTKTEHEFNTMIKPVMEQRPDLWPSSKCSFPAFVHAAGMVQSRGFHVQKDNWLTGESLEGKELYLIPGIDMINHSSNPALRSTVLEHSHDTTPRRFRMVAGRDVAAGEQILHSYGDLSDAQLLQTYGFVEDPVRPNPFNDRVRLPTSDMEKAIQLLRRHHIPFPPRAPSDDSSNTGIDQAEARLTAGNPHSDDFLELAAFYVKGMENRAEAVILISLLDTQLARMQAAPGKGVTTRDVMERRCKAAVVRAAEQSALIHLKEQVFVLLSGDDGSGDDDREDDEVVVENESEEEDSEAEEASSDGELKHVEGEGSEEESSEGYVGAQEEQQDEDESDKEEGEQETTDKSGALSNGVESSADEDAEALLLSASVLPATEKKRGRVLAGRTSSFLKRGDPVKKRLKF